MSVSVLANVFVFYDIVYSVNRYYSKTQSSAHHYIPFL